MMHFQIRVHSLYYLKGLAMKHIEPHCCDITDIVSMPEVPDRHHKVNQNFFFSIGQLYVHLYYTYVKVYID